MFGRQKKIILSNRNPRKPTDKVRTTCSSCGNTNGKIIGNEKARVVRCGNSIYCNNVWDGVAS